MNTRKWTFDTVFIEPFLNDEQADHINQKKSPQQM